VQERVVPVMKWEMRGEVKIDPPFAPGLPFGEPPCTCDQCQYISDTCSYPHQMQRQVHYGHDCIFALALENYELERDLEMVHDDDFEAQMKAQEGRKAQEAQRVNTCQHQLHLELETQYKSSGAVYVSLQEYVRDGQSEVEDQQSLVE
jgi:hypothetical protein